LREIEDRAIDAHSSCRKCKVPRAADRLTREDVHKDRSQTITNGKDHKTEDDELERSRGKDATVEQQDRSFSEACCRAEEYGCKNITLNFWLVGTSLMSAKV